MQLEKKHIVLIVGSLLLATAIGIGIYLIVRKDSDNEDSTDSKDNPPSGGTNEPPPVTNQNNTTPPPQSSIQGGKVVPIFNEENELDNPISQLKGRVLYPKRKYLGGWDYTNVRSSAEVNTESAWYDPIDNLITTINSGTPIGKVLSETAGVFNSYSYTWYKVKLIKPVGFWGTDEGYVRADTVTFVPYAK